MDVPLLSSVSVLALVGYVGMVVYRGNLIAFLEQVAKDETFLYVLAAIGILYWVAHQPVVGGPVTLIVVVAVLALLLKIFGGGAIDVTLANGQTSTGSTPAQALSDFAAGKTNPAQAFAAFAKQVGITLGLYGST